MPNLACPLKATAEEAMFDLLRLLLPSLIKLLQGPGSSAEIRCEVFLCFTQLLDCYRLMRIRHPGEYKSPVWQKQVSESHRVQADDDSGTHFFTFSFSTCCLTCIASLRHTLQVRHQGSRMLSHRCNH